MPYKCFLVRPSTVWVVEVSVHDVAGCPKGFMGTHCFEVELFRGAKSEADAIFASGTCGRGFEGVCRHCGEKRAGLISSSASSGALWERPDTGEVKRRLDEFGIGAMWFVDWYIGALSPEGTQLYGWDWDDQVTPPLCVKTPGGDWVIDSRASNCTLPNDRLHRCWVRHGEVPDITVDKAGYTCAAGAGSIMAGNYHGFLRNGYLTDGC